MNNGVNETNNLNNQNTTIQPGVQSVLINTQPVQQPVIQPVITPVEQPVVTQPEVPQTTPVVDNANQDEIVVQNIPGVVVAPPQQGGMAKPNPVVALPESETVTEPVKEEVKEEVPVVEQTPKKKKKNGLARFFFLIIVIMAGVIGYMWYTHQAEVARLNYECTPVSTTGDVKKLELDSTIVLDLYSKVKTSLKEDLALFELNDQMKVYLAFRQIPESKFYESNCNLFSSTAMEPYICNEGSGSIPLAFKEEDLKLELKKLFGERTNIPLSNVQIGLNTCVGGYQYISERGEFVQGECTNQTATSFKMDKKLVKAESKESTIMLYEEVKYYNAEGINLPDNLKSGVYIYTFKLDTNYNYAYISKVLQEK